MTKDYPSHAAGFSAARRSARVRGFVPIGLLAASVQDALSIQDDDVDPAIVRASLG